MPDGTKGQLNSPGNFSQALCGNGEAKDEETNISQQRASLVLNHSVNGIFPALSIQRGCLAIYRSVSPPYWLPDDEEGRGGFSWVETDEGKREKRQRKISGEKRQEKKESQLGCIRQSDLTRTITVSWAALIGSNFIGL